MSLKDTEFPNIILKLKEISDSYNNPALSKKLIDELFKNYKIIPLYPGIINDVISKMIKSVDVKNLKKDILVFFELNNEKYAGYISNWTDDYIELRDVTKIENINKLKIKKGKLKKFLMLNEEQLKEDWPMLIFNNKKG
jgi:hypothetical protein